MAPIAQKRRRVEDDVRKSKKKPRVKRQKHYHSSSEDEEERPAVSDAPAKKALGGKQQPPKGILKQTPVASAPLKDGAASSEEGSDDEADDRVAIGQTALNTALNAGAAGEDDSEVRTEDEGDISDDVHGDGAPIAQDAPSTEESDLDDSDSDTAPTTATTKQKKKRNDPNAFATSISKILDTKLTATKRTDPILSRSTTAAQANSSLADARLEAAARNQLKTEKRALMEKGRVRDVLGLESAEVETGRVQEEEKRLKKIAQRGVVRLFNAVRAAQVRAEKGEEIVRAEGVVGMEQRRERVGEMSKEGFLDLISRGGEVKG